MSVMQPEDKDHKRRFLGRKAWHELWSTIRIIPKWYFALVIGVLSGMYLNSLHYPIPRSQIELGSAPHALTYDGRTKGPEWVLEKLDGDNYVSYETFLPDPEIPANLRSEQADYFNSGLAMGCLLSTKSTDRSDIAYLSAVSPQDLQFNKGYWRKLEEYAREFPNKKKLKAVSITGPLYLPSEESNGEKYVKYRVIGPNNVAVPTHFFKVLYTCFDPSKDAEVFVVPNEEISEDTPLDHFKIPAEELERISGIVFPENVRAYFNSAPPLR